MKTQEPEETLPSPWQTAYRAAHRTAVVGFVVIGAVADFLGIYAFKPSLGPGR